MTNKLNKYNYKAYYFYYYIIMALNTENWLNWEELESSWNSISDPVTSETSEDVQKLLSQENMQCKDVYEVLAHRAIFFPLHELIFWTKITEYRKWMSKEERRLLFQNEENLKKVLEFAKDKENLKLLSEKIVENYKNHRDAYDRVWIDHIHKNTAWLLISYLKEFTWSRNYYSFTVPSLKYLKKVTGHIFEKSDLEEWKNKTSMKFGDNEISLVKKFEEWFEEFINSINRAYTSKVLTDTKWLLVRESYKKWSDEIKDNIFKGFSIPIAKIGESYINADTRENIKISLFNQNFELYEVKEKIKLPNGKAWFECTLFHKESYQKIPIILDQNMKPIKIWENSYLSNRRYYENNDFLDFLWYEVYFWWFENDPKWVLLDENMRILKTTAWNNINCILNELRCEKASIYYARVYLENNKNTRLSYIILTQYWEFKELKETSNWFKIITFKNRAEDDSLVKVEKDGIEYIWTIDSNLNFEISFLKSLKNKLF